MMSFRRCIQKYWNVLRLHRIYLNDDSTCNVLKIDKNQKHNRCLRATRRKRQSFHSLINIDLSSTLCNNINCTYYSLILVTKLPLNFYLLPYRTISKGKSVNVQNLVASIFFTVVLTANQKLYKKKMKTINSV